MLAVMFHDSESTLSSERVLANDPLHESGPDRPTGPAAADAGGAHQSARRQARPGQRAVAPQDRSVDVGPHHLASEETEVIEVEAGSVAVMRSARWKRSEDLLAQ